MEKLGLRATLGVLHQMGPHGDPRTLAAPPLIFPHTRIEPAARGRALYPVPGGQPRACGPAAKPGPALSAAPLAGVAHAYTNLGTKKWAAGPDLLSIRDQKRLAPGWYGGRHKIQRLFCIRAASRRGQGGGGWGGVRAGRSRASALLKWGGASQGRAQGRAGPGASRKVGRVRACPRRRRFVRWTRRRGWWGTARG